MELKGMSLNELRGHVWEAVGKMKYRFVADHIMARSMAARGQYANAAKKKAEAKAISGCLHDLGISFEMIADLEEFAIDEFKRDPDTLRYDLAERIPH